ALLTLWMPVLLKLDSESLVFMSESLQEAELEPKECLSIAKELAPLIDKKLGKRNLEALRFRKYFGRVLLSEGLYPDAADLYEDLLKRYRNNPHCDELEDGMAQAALATCYAHLGNTELAKELT